MPDEEKDKVLVEGESSSEPDEEGLPVSRRDILRYGAGAAIFTGISWATIGAEVQDSFFSNSDRNTDPNGGITTPRDNGTDTPTETEEGTKTDNGTETEESPEDFKTELSLDVPEINFVPEVSGKNGGFTTGMNVTDRNGLEDVRLFLDGRELEGVNQVLQQQLQKQNASKTGELDAKFQLKNNLIGPESVLEIQVKDTLDKEWETIREADLGENLNAGDPGYRLEFTGPQEETLGNLQKYQTERPWDNIKVTRTEKEWWKMYWNDIKTGIDTSNQYGVHSLEQFKPFIDQSKETMDERAFELFKGISDFIYQETGIESSGASSALFYAAERGLARDIWNLKEDEYFATWIRGNSGVHEVNFIAYDANAHLDNAEEDWQLRFHNTHAVHNWHQTYEDGKPDSYAKPENTPYRVPFGEENGIIRDAVDAFNYSKLQKRVNLSKDDFYKLEDIHTMPAESLMNFVDTSTNDLNEDNVDGAGDNIVFEESYLKSLQENTSNENFDRESLDNLINAGRKIYEAAGQLDVEEDFIGIGGELGNETVYRLNKSQYEEALHSFQYDPFTEPQYSQSGDKMGPVEPLNDLSKLVN